MWNHSSQIYPRTNNTVESFHGSLKKIIGAPHPDIFKAIELLKRIETRSCLTFSQLKNGSCKSERDKFDREKDACLQKLIDQCDSMSIGEYLKSVSDYIGLKKKKSKLN